MEHPAITLVDQVHWAFSNVISSLEGAAWTVETGELIDILDGVIVRYGSPDPRRVEIVPSNNDFN